MLISVHFKVTVLDFYFFRLSVRNSGTEKTLRLLYKYAEQTVKDTITECRISTAKDLLSAADVHIKEIMVKCGFQSENHFFAFF